ncbi:MAG TPA: threonine synthase [Chitinophagaceae bacterium]|nr:threonine synthase [Chitinophagaceae bacterium]
MKFYSTKNPTYQVPLEQAVFESLPPDNGLYMPVEIPKLPADFFKNIHDKSFIEIAYTVAQSLIGDSIDAHALQQIIEEAINFPAPIKKIEENIHVLELFHGPSMAFKDFGARFMSRVMHYFLEKDKKEIDILVATSGDTGGAVALGFYDVPGINVTILYPKGKVSPLQEKQLTTLGKNITALEIDGTFDDCQKLVKTAFLDKELSKTKNLSSANSINIARLIPQTFYYFNAYAQLKKQGINGSVTFSVPSGNFGNITAGLFAAKMGLPVHHFVASTNINDEVPQYLKSGIFTPKPSKHTLSNAMDVGNPSNFERMLSIFNNNVEKMRAQISGYTFTDKDTLNTIEKVRKENHYMLCPHTAIAYAGLKEYLSTQKEPLNGIFLSSAHPCKFPNVYDEESWQQVEIPSQAKHLKEKEKQAIPMTTNYDNFKEWLMK